MINIIPTQALYEFNYECNKSKIPFRIIKNHRFKEDSFYTMVEVSDQFVNSAGYIMEKVKEKHRRVRV